MRGCNDYWICGDAAVERETLGVEEVECKCIIYTTISCLFTRPPAYLRDGRARRGLDISIYLYIRYQMFTIPAYLPTLRWDTMPVVGYLW